MTTYEVELAGVFQPQATQHLLCLILGAAATIMLAIVMQFRGATVSKAPMPSNSRMLPELFFELRDRGLG